MIPADMTVEVSELFTRELTRVNILFHPYYSNFCGEGIVCDHLEDKRFCAFLLLQFLCIYSSWVCFQQTSNPRVYTCKKEYLFFLQGMRKLSGSCLS